MDVRNEEFAEILVRSRQALWIVRAASCGADTCPAPDAATALRMIHTAVNGLHEIATELEQRGHRSMTPARIPPSIDRAGVERLVQKSLLELEELQRNVAYLAREMALTVDGADAARLAAASVALEREVSGVRMAMEAALLSLEPG